MHVYSPEIVQFDTADESVAAFDSKPCLQTYFTIRSDRLIDWLIDSI